MPENEGSKPPKAQKPRFCAREGWQEGLGAAAGQRKEHREEERELRATKIKRREDEMRTNLFIFEVGQVKAVLGCNEEMFLL